MFDPTQIPDDVLGVCRHLSQAGHQAHLVGGGIRDLLLGRQPADFDVATNALPDAVLKLFGSRYAIPTLLYLFRRIENSATGPKAFVLDEGWVPLGHPLFRERAKTWFNTYRGRELYSHERCGE